LSRLDALNEAIAHELPAASACLSPIGRRAVYPRGIPAQSREAADCAWRATIGQVTDGRGNPLAPPSLAEQVPSLDARAAFLYTAQGGDPALRRAWKAWQEPEGGGVDRPLPLVTAGLTHALAIAAELFAGEGTDVLLSRPCWGNYLGIFQMRRGANIHRYDFFDAGREGFDAASLARALAARAGRPCVLVLNFPGNPTGYSPREDEVPAIVETLLNHPGPLVVLFDDAYQGMVYRDDVQVDSLFWAIARRADPAGLLPVKIDGATKELFFFGGRVGFLTFGAAGDGASALEEKARAINRAMVSAMPGPSQAIVLEALRRPGSLRSEITRRRALLKRRYQVLQRELGRMEAAGLKPYPNNAGCFALVGVEPPLEADALRRRLIEEFSVGVIAVPEINALRLAFCSMDSDAIPEVVQRLVRAAR